MAEHKKIIAVLGATGAQGGAVVEALLAEGKFGVRAIVRDPSKENAKKLAEKGAEVVKGDAAKKEDLIAAFKGVHGVFGLTMAWDPNGTGKELEYGFTLNEAVKEAGVKHYIFSSLPNADAISNKKWHVTHFTDKKIIEENARKMGIPTVGLGPAFYFQNFQTMLAPKKTENGLVFSLPLELNHYLTAFDVNDIGPAAVSIFHDFQKYDGKFIPLAGSHAHPQDYVKEFVEVTGVKATYQPIPLDVYAKLPFPGAEELAQMFGWFRDYTYFGPNADLEIGRKVHPGLKTWKEWLQKTGWKGPQ